MLITKVYFSTMNDTEFGLYRLLWLPPNLGFVKKQVEHLVAIIIWSKMLNASGTLAEMGF